MSGQVIIADLTKGERERVRISLDSIRGAEIIDIRFLAPFGGPANAFAPTSKGIALPLAMLPSLAVAVAEAERQARALGLLGAAK